VCMLVVAMLFAPIKNKLQVWADRWFYGERYTLRTGLQDFGRTLAQTTALPQLFDSLVRRLSDMLSVRKVAIFIEDANSPSGFSLARLSGIEGNPTLPVSIRQIIRMRSMGRGLITIEDIPKSDPSRQLEYAISNSGIDAFLRKTWLPPVPGREGDDSLGRSREDLYYYVPCVVRDRMVAIIGIERAASGALLTSEDTDLLRALSGYVAVAIENSLLYESEMDKAEEFGRMYNAVPIEAAEKIRSDFVRFGEARHGWVGINVSEAPAPVEGSRAEMTEIMEATPAANSGVKPGDILLQVGRTKVTQPEDVLDASFYITAGDTVPITVVRDGKKLTFNVQAEIHPASERRPLIASPTINRAIPLKLDSEGRRTP